MAEEPVWQPNYTDMSDDRSVRFGAECVVCHARYASAPQPLEVTLLPGEEPDAAARKAIDDQKYDHFRDFDAAFRSIVIFCYRCGRPACPDCWDVDKQMCGACVADRGLVRSPHRGEPVAGPLADGFLRRIEPGRYAEAGRPVWLKELLRAQADPAAALTSTRAMPAVSGVAPGPATPADGSYPRVPALPPNPKQTDAPTFKMSTPAATPLPPPSFNDMMAGAGVEGEATSSLIECPRCGAPNYDFVTQCSECGLQMIQVCPSCERLNPGHIDRCQFCGTELERPGGWTSVSGAIKPLDPKEGRKRMASRPIAPRPAKPAAQARVFPNVPSRPINSAPVSPGQRAAVAQAVLELQPPPRASASAEAHPYELVGSDLRPVAMTMPVAYKLSFGARLALAFERLLTVALVLAIVGLVGLIGAAETSPQANHWITATLHVDVKAHIDGFLTWLNLTFRQR